jgi:hypothetical protein
MAGNQKRPRITAESGAHGTTGGERLTDRGRNLPVAGSEARFHVERRLQDGADELRHARKIETYVRKILRFTGEMALHAVDDGVHPGRRFIFRISGPALGIGQQETGQTCFVPGNGTEAERSGKCRVGHAKLDAQWDDDCADRNQSRETRRRENFRRARDASEVATHAMWVCARGLCE